MDEAQLVKYLKDNYNLQGEWHALPGELGLHYRLTTPGNNRYVVKINQEPEAGPWLDLQHRAMDHVHGRIRDFGLPYSVPDLHGSTYQEIQPGMWLQVLEWVPGRLFAQVNPQSPELLADTGKKLAGLTSALRDFDHPHAHRFLKWNIAEISWTKPHQDLFAPTERSKIQALYHRFEIQQTAWASLRKQVLYHDANDYNILVTPDPYQPSIAGFIDFGDIVYTQTIHDLAIACTYLLMGKPDPVHQAIPLIQAYHKHHPLTPEEIHCLGGCIGARLLISATVAVINLKDHPENTYLQVSNQGVWEMIDHWLDTDPAYAEMVFRQACGWEPSPKRYAYDQWIGSHPSFQPVIQADWNLQGVYLDLGIASTALGHFEEYVDLDTFDNKIRQMVGAKRNGIGYGGYREIRPLYTSDHFRDLGAEGPRWRTQHLGLDLWSPAGEPVHAPWEGTVHSLQDNQGDRNYGATIILEHHSGDLTFYTLYGHLSRNSLSGLAPGQQVKAGDCIAHTGAMSENGGWPPHLHFQIILDLHGWTGDFPGVAYASQIDIWSSNNPDPMLWIPPLAAAEAERRKNRRPDQTELLHRRENVLGPNLSLSYRQPLQMLRGEMSYLIAADGRKYLDTVNNVAHAGHENKRVVRAGQNQMAVLNTNTRYLHPAIIDCAEYLLAKAPRHLEVCYFVNSGSEANELAMRMARTITGRSRMAALDMGYHGNTQACVDVSSYKFNRKGGKGQPEHTLLLPRPDPYRGILADHLGSDRTYARDAMDRIRLWQQQEVTPAALIAETIMSCGGQIVPPEDYFPAVYAAMHQAGGLCIADEVQHGLGRVGDHFFAFEKYGVKPDMVTIGKPFGNGHPLGAVLTTRAVAEAFHTGMEYFNTFGGNPVSATIGLEVLRILDDEGLPEHASRMGLYLKKNLAELAVANPIIGDVRGEGLFLGFELVADPGTKMPATRAAGYLVNRMRTLGILMSTDGPDDNVIKIKPPMCITREQIDLCLQLLSQTLKEDAMQI